MKKNIMCACLLLGVSFQLLAQSTEITPGNVRASSLGGTGIRTVTSNSIGGLGNQAATGNAGQYIVIPAASFHSIDGQSMVDFVSGQIAGLYNTQIQLIAPVNFLPYNVTVTKVSACILDNNQGTNLEIKFNEVYPDPALSVITNTNLATIIPTGNGANFQCTDLVINKTLDYTKKSYYFEVKPVGAGIDSGFWSGNLGDLALVQIVLFYN